MEKEGKISEEVTPVTDLKNQYVCISKSKPDTSMFSKEELDSIDSAIERYGHLWAHEISDISHLDTPWRIADMYDVIDYEAVFYRTKATSVIQDD